LDGRRDSVALSIAHLNESRRIIIDLAVERKAPHSPSEIVKEFSELLKAYRIYSVRGDRFGGEWPREAYRKESIAYQLSELTASELYLAGLPSFLSEAIELPESPRLRGQLLSLMRRTSTGGRDAVVAASGTDGHCDQI
jgi:hypothetical protein